MAIVYIHRRKDINDSFKNVFYVGIGKTNNRPISKFKRNKHWHKIVNEYGYAIEITHKDLSWEEACSIEKYLISFYGRVDLRVGNLTNLTNGGDGTYGYKLSKEHIEILKKVNSNRIVSVETRNKLSIINYGKKLSKETKDKIGNANRNISPERKEKLRVSNIGKKISEQTKRKMSEARKGIKGKKTSEQTKRKMSEAHKGKKRIFSEDHKNNIRKSKIGKTLSLESRNKISLANRGKKYPNRIMPKQTEEHKAKISDVVKKYHQNKISN
jgi:hypothetical protein